MDFVFEIIDKTGREIRLTSRQWKHILDHGDVDVEDLENVKNALVSPSSLLMQNLDDLVISIDSLEQKIVEYRIATGKK